jgi:hypothetical protein
MGRDIGDLPGEIVESHSKKTSPCNDSHEAAALTQPDRPSLSRWFFERKKTHPRNDSHEGAALTQPYRPSLSRWFFHCCHSLYAMHDFQGNFRDYFDFNIIDFREKKMSLWLAIGVRLSQNAGPCQV